MKKLKLLTVMGMAISLILSAQSLAYADYDDDDDYNDKVKNVVVKEVTINEKDSAKISGINVDWLSGNVTVSKSTTKEIKIIEKAYVMPANNKKFTYKTDGGMIYIDDNIDEKDLSVSANSEKDFKAAMKKIKEAEVDLQVYLPEKEYSEFVLNTISGEYKLLGLSVNKLTGKTVNGEIYIGGMKIKELNATTVNGEIDVNRTTRADNIKLDAVNGDINVVCEVMPKSLKASIVNGDMEITLPENEGFTIPVLNSELARDFDSEFSLTSKGNSKVYKNGKFVLDISCVNGDIELDKLK